MSKAKQDIRQSAMREMIIHSFFDWKSAVVLALVILLTAQPSLPPSTLAVCPLVGAGLADLWYPVRDRSGLEQPQ